MKESSEITATFKGSRLLTHVRRLFSPKGSDTSEASTEAVAEASLFVDPAESADPAIPVSGETPSIEISPVSDISILDDELDPGNHSLFTEPVVAPTIAVAVDPRDPKEVLESEITPDRFGANFLDRLATLDLESPGNPHLITTLLSKFEYWEQNLKSHQLSALAEMMNTSESDVEERLQQRMEELMMKSHFFCATSTEVFINHILRGDRRFKNMIELLPVGSTYVPTRRSDTEFKLFDFPVYGSPEGERVKSSRPTYGYFSLNSDGIMNASDSHPPPNSVKMFGRVTVKIKRGVAERRATMCLRDSYFVDAPISPVALPHYSVLFDYWETNPSSGLNRAECFLERPLSNKTLSDICGAYTEVQFHGGLTVDDIESVHLSLGNELDQDGIDRVTAAVKAYNQETGNNIVVVIY